MDQPELIVNEAAAFAEPHIRVMDGRDQLLRLTVDGTTDRYRLHWQEDGDLADSHAALLQLVDPGAIQRIELSHDHGAAETVLTGDLLDLTAGIGRLRAAADREITGFTVSTPDGSFAATDWGTHLEHRFVFTDQLADRLETVVQRSRHTDRLREVTDALLDHAQRIRPT